jgi:WD40 repeat protein
MVEDASDEINCISWGQQLLAAAGADKTVRIYDVTKEPRPGAGS